MAKSAYINVRVEEAVKLDSEKILNELGINTSTAIDMFLKQIILQDGLPFDVRIPKNNYETELKEIVEQIEFNPSEPHPLWLKKLAILYAKKEIDLEVATFAAKKHLTNL